VREAVLTNLWLTALVGLTGDAEGKPSSSMTTQLIQDPERY
jgi:hypothetical protein